MSKNIIKVIVEKVKFEVRKNYGFFLNKIISIDIASTEITLRTIITRGASVGRFGDGELDIIEGKSLKFQDYDYTLAEKLKEVIKVDDEKFLVCIPYAVKSLEELDDKGSQWWNVNLYNNRFRWLRLLNRNIKYYDAFISRFYMEVRHKVRSKQIINNWKLIWNKRNIIIVEGNKSRLGVGNDLFDNAQNIKRILCPETNAFTRYNEILEIFKSDKVNKDNLILISLGPTATVLAYDLHLLGYQAIDIGHIDIEYEWYLSNAKEKIKISNKYVNEIQDNQSLELDNDIENIKYENEILFIIKKEL